MQLDYALSPEERSFREEIIAFSRAHLNDGAIERDRSQRFPQDLWLKCSEMGLQGLLIPAEYGGRGLTPLQAALALEALGYGCVDSGLSFAICAHLLACTVPIVRHGTEEQKRAWLPGLANGSIIAANAMSEPGTGSDAFALATSAKASRDGFILNGTKTFVSNAPVASLFVVYAATDGGAGFHGGVSCFLVPSLATGLVIGKPLDKLALRSCLMGEVGFDGVEMGPESVLGGTGAGGPVFAESMEWERVLIAALHVGTMERILEQAVIHAKTRKASGQSIGKFQAVAHRLADMKVQLEATRNLVYRSATTLGRTREAGLGASITKVFASEALLASATAAVRNLGGAGVLVENEIERALRDAVAAATYSGTSDIQRNIISRWLGL